MGTVTLPKLSQTGANEWADVEDNDKALRDEFNGNIENVNIKSTAAIAHSKLAAMTAGYVLLGNGSTVPTATAVTGDVTISSSGVTALAADTVGATELAPLPVCILQASSSSLANDNLTVETWASESVDTDTMHSTSANTSRITITTAGVYRILASLYIPNGQGLTAGDGCSTALYVNGVQSDTHSDYVNATVSYSQVEAVINCSAADYFEVLYSQNSGASVDATKRFSVTYISPAS